MKLWIVKEYEKNHFHHMNNTIFYNRKESLFDQLKSKRVAELILSFSSQIGMGFIKATEKIIGKK